jgi:hypothetical protein
MLTLEETRPGDPTDPARVLLAYVYFYDARGGGVECGFKQDQHGLGRRNKKRFPAQAMLLWLEALAHNVLLWARAWLAPSAPAIARYGVLRLVRDALAIPGSLERDTDGLLRRLVLRRAHPLAAKMQQALQRLLDAQQIQVCLGEI